MKEFALIIIKIFAIWTIVTIIIAAIGTWVDIKKSQKGDNMKPKNFPARKLKRKLIAQSKNINEYQFQLEEARGIKTKKDRTKRG